jgi:TrmH family RNA methyltransferase
MDDKLITSTTNPIVKRIRSLQQRKHREEQRAFFVEGIRPVWQAVASGAEVETLVYAPDLLTSESARQMIEMHGATGIEVVKVSTSVFERIAQREHPSGLGAVVHIAPRKLDDLAAIASSVFVGLNKAGNPGNIGTIIRTLDAVGGGGLILIGNGADPYHPSAVKASMGTLFNVPIAHVANFDEMLAWSGSHHVNVITTSPRATSPYWSVEYSPPMLFLFGSEGEGLPGDVIERGNIAVCIPMAGSAD